MLDDKITYSLSYVDSYGEHHEISFHPHEYMNLMMLIWDRAIEDWGDCKGRAWCRSCHLEIKENKHTLPVPDGEEKECLNNQSNTISASRLACQLMLTKDLDGAVIRYLGPT